jgi:hypothetical protein
MPAPLRFTGDQPLNLLLKPVLEEEQACPG